MAEVDDIGMFGRLLRNSAGQVSGAFSDAAQSAVGITGNLLSGSMALSDYTDALVTNTDLFGVLGDTIKGLTKFAEQSLEEYQTLSGIGATFGKEMTEIKMTAAELGMSVEDMTKMFQQNMSSLSAFGGTTDSAIASFRAFSNEVLSSDVGTNLRRLGYTVGDINELLLLQGELIQQDPRGANQDISAQSAQDLANEMDRLAKLTGKQRDEIADQMRADRRRGDLQFYLQGKSAEEQDAFNKSLANVRATLGDGAADAFIDMAIRGAPVTEATQQAFLAMGTEGQAAMTDMIAQLESGASFEEVSGTMNRFQGSVVDYMNSSEAAQIGMLGGMNGVSGAYGDLKENMYDFENRINAAARPGESAADTIARLNSEMEEQQRIQMQTDADNILDSTIAMQETIRETVVAVQEEALQNLEAMGVSAVETVRDTIGDNIGQITGFVQNAVSGLFDVAENVVNGTAPGSTGLPDTGTLTGEDFAEGNGAAVAAQDRTTAAVEGANAEATERETVTQEAVAQAEAAGLAAETASALAETRLTELQRQQHELAMQGQFDRAADLQTEIDSAESEATRAAEMASATQRTVESLSHMQRTGSVRGFADGGRMNAGELAMVGEQGPELMFGPGTVFDNATSGNILSLVNNARGIKSAVDQAVQDQQNTGQNDISNNSDIKEMVQVLQDRFGHLGGLMERLVQIESEGVNTQRRTYKATKGLNGNLLKGVNA